MKKLLVLLFCLLFANAFASGYVITAAQQSKLTPKQALQKLITGNKRHVAQELRSPDHNVVLKKNAKGQYPFAFIFNCVDSRSVPEISFDQSTGNMFAGAMAGNVVDPYVLGSMEFATKLAGAKLIVVMGHTACGAVAGACSGAKLGNLTALLKRIGPAVAMVRAKDGKDFSCESSKVIDQIAKQNVLNQLRYILKNSAVIAKLVQDKKIMLVGAMHNLADGKVTFFNMRGKTIG